MDAADRHPGGNGDREAAIRPIFLAWALYGVLFTTTSLYAEWICQYGRDIFWHESKRAKDHPELAKEIVVTMFAKGTELLEQAGKLSPELHWIRSAPAYMALIDPMMPDETAIRIMRTELQYDPYYSDLLMMLAMRLMHAGRPDEAYDVWERIEQIWPGSPPSVAIGTLVRDAIAVQRQQNRQEETVQH